MSSPLTIEGSEIRAVSPEGATSAMPLDDFFQKVTGRPPAARTAILPDGIKATATRGPMEIWIHQIPPRVHQFRWIAPDSPAPFGENTTYRTVHIALPYLITLGLFVPGKRGLTSLSKANECFFATRPLGGWDDELCYPALLNCSKFNPPDRKPLSWICTQFLDRSFEQEPDHHIRLRRAFAALLGCLLHSGFNRSSEHHEETSWFSASTSIDPRVATVEAWEEASSANSLFVLDVPWIPTGLSLGQIVDRIFSNHNATIPDVGPADALSRIVFNHGAALPVSASADDSTSASVPSPATP